MTVRPIDSAWLKRNLNKVFPRECDQLYGMLQLIDESPTLTSPNEWVSVEEKLPPPKQNVLAYSTRSGIAEADYADGVWMQYRWSAVMESVTHWMPLPEPPDCYPPEGEDDT